MTTYDFISANKRKTWLLIIGFTIFVGLIGYFLDRYYQTGGSILIIALIYAIGSALVGYFAGDKFALNSAKAQPATVESNPYLVRKIENLCIAIGMETPKIYIIPDQSINAFATGRNPKHASIAVTEGAISKLENEELEGVLAHELSHIKNYDIRVMTLVVVLAGVIAVVADMAWRSSWSRRRNDSREGGIINLLGFALIILAPIIGTLIKLAVSRRREYLADADSALMTRFPDGLARALAKISSDQPMAKPSTATAHLYIANPFGSKISNLFSTHPPIADRIEALRKMDSPNNSIN